MPDLCSGCGRSSSGSVRIGLAEHRTLWLLPFFYSYSKDAHDSQIDVPCCARCRRQRLLVAGGVAVAPWFATLGCAIS